MRYILIALLVFMVGCATVPTDDSIKQDQQQLVTIQTAIDALESNLERIQAEIEADPNLTPEQLAELRAEYNAITAKVAELEAQAKPITEKIDAVLAMLQQQDSIGSIATGVGQMLPGWPGWVLTALGVIAGGLQQRTSERRKLTAVVRTLDTARDVDGAINWKTLGDLQAAAGVREVVRGVRS